MQDIKKQLEIGELLTKGTKFRAKYHSIFYDIDLSLRPLSDYELRKVLVKSTSKISNKETGEFWLASEEKRGKMKKEQFAKVNTNEIEEAELELDAWMVYLVLKNQIEGLTLEKTKEIYDITRIAAEIDVLSGSAKKEIAFFRDNGVWRESKTIDEISTDKAISKPTGRNAVSVTSIESTREPGNASGVG